VIQLDNIHKVFGDPRRPDRQVVALRDVTVHVGAGEVMGVVGRSGSGKSTLARCANLLERPTTGTVSVDGQRLTDLPDAELRRARRRIGMIFQHINLLDSRTAAGNVEHPLELAGVPRRERRARAAELLDRVGLADKHAAYPAQLSGGQKQRVAIARALAPRPSVLLCDEATSALDPASTASVLGLLRSLTDDLGLTVLLITHEMHVVKSVCDSATLLDAGTVLDAGRLADVIRRPGSPLAEQLVPPPAARRPGPGAALLQLTVAGEPDGDPALTVLTTKFGLEVDVVAGSVETIGGQRYGHLQLETRGSAPDIDDAVAHLRSTGTLVEVAR
jgi:D-methionine transport system ATP-binding protein